MLAPMKKCSKCKRSYPIRLPRCPNCGSSYRRDGFGIFGLETLIEIISGIENDWISQQEAKICPSKNDVHSLEEVDK